LHQLRKQDVRIDKQEKTIGGNEMLL